MSVLGIRPADEVLLPAFHCVSLVEPIVQQGARCRFYGVDRNLRIDRNSLEDAISSKTRVLVVVHFFGFPAPLDDIRELCALHGTLLLEDCCHALFSRHGDRDLGLDGHLALFSFRKTLPVLDGALLVANEPSTPIPMTNRRADWRFAARSLMTAIEQLANGPRTVDAVRRSGPDGTEQRTVAPRQAQVDLTEDGWRFGYDVNPALNDRPGTWISQWIASRVFPEAIRSARRRNFGHLLQSLSDLEGIRLPIRELPTGVCPWTFPLESRSGPGLDRRLRLSGVPAFTFGETLHAELREGEFPEAESLALSLVQLPVHQNLTEWQVEWMAEAVRKVVANP